MSYTDQDFESISGASLGQVAYEIDLTRKPTYHDGQPRKTWAQLDEHARWSWNRNPTPRNYPCPPSSAL